MITTKRQNESIEMVKALTGGSVQKYLANKNTHGLVANDCLYSSWGYDQTNVDFYRVVRTTKTMVVLQQLEAVKNENGPTAMRGTTTPTDKPATVWNHDTQQREDAPLLRRKVQTGRMGDCVKLESYSYAHKWDGTPQQFTSYA